MKRLEVRRALLPAVMMLAASALSVVSASAATGVATLSEAGQDAVFTKIAVGPDGTAVAVWRRLDGLNQRIQVSHRPPGGDWASPQTLSESGQDTNGPQVAIGPDGTATAVWGRFDGNHNRVQVSTRAPGGSWSIPENLSDPLGGAFEPQVAIGPNGAPTVVWHRYDGADNRIQVTTRAPGGSWSIPQTLSDLGESALRPQLAHGADGTTTVVWTRYDGTDNRTQVSTRPPSGVWSSAQTLSDAGENTGETTIVTASDGTTTVAWERLEIDDNLVQVSARPPGGAWSSVQTLADDAYDPELTAGPGATTTLVWYRYDGAFNRIQTSTRTPGGAWTGPVTVSEVGKAASNSEVAMAPDGSTLLTWVQFDGVNELIMSATRSPAGAWSSPTTISPPGFNASDPEVAIGEDGTAGLAWTGSDGAVKRAQAIVYDDQFPAPVVVPDTSAIKGKKKITKAKASYKFSSPTPGAAFECRVDKKFKKYAGVSKKKAKKQVPWKACTSPYVVKAKKLQNGTHKLYVRAVLAGQVDPTPSVKKLVVRR